MVSFTYIEGIFVEQNRTPWNITSIKYKTPTNLIIHKIFCAPLLIMLDENVKDAETIMLGLPFMIINIASTK